LTQLKDFYKSSEQEHREFMQRFRENFRFAAGGDNQWEPEDLAQLNEDGKPHLTYNEILPKLNVLVGEYVDNMMDVTVLPRRKGTATGAHILTSLAKHTSDLCGSEYEEAACFLNGITGGIGVLTWKRDYSHDPFNGDIVIVNRWPADVIFDESAREYDHGKSGKFVFDCWWWDKQQLALTYPKRGKDIFGEGLEGPNDSFTPSGRWYDRAGDDYGDPGDSDVEEPDEGDGRKLRYRVRECWWRSFEKSPHIWDKEKAELIRLTPKTLERARVLAMRAPHRFVIRDHISPVLHKTVQAGRLILEDIDDPLGVQISRIPYARFCPYWLGGYIMGAVDNAKDPQREVNKRMSQVLHILNQTANIPWLNKNGSADEEDLEDAARIAKVINYTDVKPEQGDPPRFPEGHAQLAAMNSDIIGRVMGVREPMEGGVESKDQSGVAIQLRQNQGLKMAKPIFNNFRQTRQLTYEGVVEMIRYTDVYSEAEIRQIVDEEDLIDAKMLNDAAREVGQPPQPPKMPDQAAMAYVAERAAEPRYRQLALAVESESQRATEQFEQQQQQYQQAVQQRAQQMLLEQIKQIGTGRYGIQVSQSPNAPTLRLAHFQQLLNARREGMAIPDDVIIEASDWPNKEKIIQRMRENAEAQIQQVAG